MLKKRKKRYEFLKSAAIITAFAIGIGFYYINKSDYINKPPKRAVQNENQALTDDQAILAQLKKIILLPEDIDPNMAVILDVEALKKQQPNFFINAKNGDRIIIYPDLAIIYDPQASKIIKIGPVKNSEPKNAEPNNQ